MRALLLRSAHHTLGLGLDLGAVTITAVTHLDADYWKLKKGACCRSLAPVISAQRRCQPDVLYCTAQRPDKISRYLLYIQYQGGQTVFCDLAGGCGECSASTQIGLRESATIHLRQGLRDIWNSAPAHKRNTGARWLTMTMTTTQWTSAQPLDRLPVTVTVTPLQADLGWGNERSEGLILVASLCSCPSLIEKARPWPWPFHQSSVPGTSRGYTPGLTARYPCSRWQRIHWLVPISIKH